MSQGRGSNYTSESGIAADMYRYVLQLLGDGKAYAFVIITTGDRVSHRILPDVNYILPALSVNNNGSSAILIGADGNAQVTLPAGASYTWRYKNPSLSKLVYNDNGHSGVEVDIIS